jgi:hypothetical protein
MNTVKNLSYILIVLVFSSFIIQDKNVERDKSIDKLLIVKLFKAKTNELTLEIKDSLLQVKHITRYLGTGDDLEKEELWLEIDSTKNSIRVECDGNINSSIEYKAVTFKNKIKLIYSTIGGNDQSGFEIYDYDSITEKLNFDNISTNFFKLRISDFFIEGTPDSVIMYYQSRTTVYYDICYAKKGVAEYILSLYIRNEDYDKWFAGEIITFDVENNKFTKTKPHFRE